MNYYELLKTYIKCSGLSLSEISERLKEHGFNISKGYISQLQNGKTENPATVELNRALAAVTGGDVEKLLTAALIEKAPAEIKEKIERLNTLKKLKSEYDAVAVKEVKNEFNFNYDKLVKIPLLGVIAAGQPIDRIEMIEDFEYVNADVLRGREAFALRVKGDSMIGDYITEGDVVICVVQKEVTSNEIAVVAVESENATVKRVKCQGDVCMLIPSNPKMQPTLVSSKKVEVLGKVVEVRRRF